MPPSTGAAPTPPRDAWGLSEADKAEGIARIFGTQASPATEPAPLDHDAAEQAAMVAHYAEEPIGRLLPPPRQDALRDGLFRGFHAHRHVWDTLPYGPERGAAFADARAQPGACPICAGRRWWRGRDDPETALRCAACHPPDHLSPQDLEVIAT